MATNNVLRTNTGGKILNSVAKAGAVLNGTPEPGVGTSGNTQELIDATNYTTYISDAGLMYRKENEIWQPAFTQVGPGSGGPVVAGANVGSGTGDVYNGTAVGIIEFKRLKSSDNSVFIANDVDSVNFTVAGGGPQNNTGAIVPPSITDDSSIGYSIGSEWTFLIPASEDQMYKCVDASVGAAQWQLITNEPVVRTRVPNSGDDELGSSNSGIFKPGDLWFDSRPSYEHLYVCINNTTNSAIWGLTAGGEQVLKWAITRSNTPVNDKRYSYVMRNDGSSQTLLNLFDPDFNNPYPSELNDVGEGYSAGSIYQAKDLQFTCSSNDPLEAQWDGPVGAGNALLDVLNNQPSIDPNAQLTYKINIQNGVIEDVYYDGSNFNALVDPTAADNASLGYGWPGNMWLNNTTGVLWIKNSSLNWIQVGTAGPTPDIKGRGEFIVPSDLGVQPAWTAGVSTLGDHSVLAFASPNAYVPLPQLVDPPFAFDNYYQVTPGAAAFKKLGARGRTLCHVFYNLTASGVTSALQCGLVITPNIPPPGIISGGLFSSIVVRGSESSQSTTSWSGSADMILEDNDVVSLAFTSLTATSWGLTVDSFTMVFDEF